MTKTMQMASVCWILAAGLFLVACINPRAIYWGGRAWQYRDPGANEPSPAAYAMQRVGAFVSAAVLCGMGFVLMHWESQSTYDAGDVKSAVDDVVARLDQEKVQQGGILSPDYYLAVDTVMRKVTGDVLSDLTFEPAGKTDDGGEKFTISSRKTGSPYCLTVTTGVSVKNAPAEPTNVGLIATARKGACKA
ncbi:hypothetical protein [Streptomyces olivoreticuli]|uniref:hypothetical protein n=1 Tax=Streptomyces olivoreticuli TaxID=68246 RepID=UPI000E23EAFF|nr:hypothetical protein [Streptomyces olivoreticuli]